MLGLLAVLFLVGCGGEATPVPMATATFPPPPEVVAKGTAVAAYPAPTEPTPLVPTATPVLPATAYPVPPTLAPTGTPAGYPPSGGGAETVYMPLIGSEDVPTATPSPTPLPTATPSPTPTPIPTLDFTAIEADLAAQGQALAFSKMGFHTGGGGNRNGLGEWMRRHDEAGAPFFLKSVWDAGPLLEGQQLSQQSGVPHTLVFRASGNEYDTPNYGLPPVEAARAHWALHVAAWPPELDPAVVWLETLNEVDKNRSAWLAEFALETARLALAEGRRWAAFGWSAGEPEVSDWEQPAMLEFLRLVAAHPDQLAIALHEYSYTIEDIGDQYPYKVGRFQQLFAVCDAHGIARPTVLITEWGWEYQHVPTPERALRDVAWAAGLYAPHPQVRGAAIWYLGPGFGDIANETQRLIAPVLGHNLTTFFAVEATDKPVLEPERFRP